MYNPTPSIDPEEKDEAARNRRRWLTLAEVLGVAAVLISALTLWNNYQQRTSEAADKVAARQAATAASQTLLLRGSPDRDGKQLVVTPADPSQTVQEQRIRFPSSLEIAAVETLSEPRIEVRWFERPLLRARSDERAGRGDARLPVLIETTFFSGGAMHRDLAIYDIGYRIEGGGLLGGDEVRLRGLSRVERVSPALANGRLDALWRARLPAQDR